MSAFIIAFVNAHPVAAGVIAACIVSAVGFPLLSFRWASKPTIIRPSDFGDEVEQ